MKFKENSIRILSLVPAAALCLLATMVQAAPAPAATPPSALLQLQTSPGPIDSSNPENKDTATDTKPAITKSEGDANSTTLMSRDKRAFDALDSNHDGFISKLEGQQGGISDYSDADRNGDARLDPDEFNAGNAGARSVAPTKPLSARDSRNSAYSSKKPH